MRQFFTKLKVKRYLGTGRALKLELGAGPFHIKGWIGLDLDKDSDLVWDLRRGIPFPTHTITQIHSEHFFEHLNPEDTNTLLRECHRVLKPGGVISFSVPDIGKIIMDYAKGPKHFWQARDWWMPHPWIKTPMDVLSWYAMMGGEHRAMYDQDTAKTRLKEAGFKQVKIRQFNPKLDYNFRVSSLYVQGTK